MTNELTIRTIQETDKAEIMQLIAAINEAEDFGYSLTDEWFAYVIYEMSEHIFVAATEQNRVLGMSVCMLNQPNDQQAAMQIMVHPSFRCKGIGTRLYNKILEHALKKQLHVLEVLVKERLLKAVKFVQNRGFYAIRYAWYMELQLENMNAYPMDNKKLLFRNATEKDSHAYTEILNLCFEDQLQPHALEVIGQDPSIKVYFIEKDQKIIGTSTIQKRSASLGYIYDVAVLEPYRGHGIGSLLLKYSLNELIASDLKKASLLVTGENKSATALYHKLGFKEVDKDIIMQKSL